MADVTETDSDCIISVQFHHLSNYNKLIVNLLRFWHRIDTL